jgi:hypothetical protein
MPPSPEGSKKTFPKLDSLFLKPGQVIQRKLFCKAYLHPSFYFMQFSAKRNIYTGIGLAVLATLIWSGNFIIARGVIKDIPPISLNFISVRHQTFQIGVAISKKIMALPVLGFTHRCSPFQHFRLYRRSLYISY